MQRWKWGLIALLLSSLVVTSQVVIPFLPADRPAAAGGLAKASTPDKDLCWLMSEVRRAPTGMIPVRT